MSFKFPTQSTQKEKAKTRKPLLSVRIVHINLAGTVTNQSSVNSLQDLLLSSYQSKGKGRRFYRRHRLQMGRMATTMKAERAKRRKRIATSI